MMFVWAMEPDDAQAGAVSVAGPFGSFNVEAKSLKEMRWDNVIRQQYDFSCGSAAVATLLTYHYGQETTEVEVFKTMYQEGEKDKIQAQGFSMLDMKRYLDYRGLNADGFRIALDDFIKIGVPAITLINTQGYKHFVVIKGTDEDEILVGDPAVGTVVVEKARFEAMWNGVVLGARADVELARQNFNSEQDWRVRPDSPLKQGISRAGVSTMLLTLPATNELTK
ncbi:C39 family peptidase [Halomonas sp. M20]|uniref:C39 family peptidase n=1 Tax=Halomonas sp. M20 TaxID=2763264 RepID=UPI001D09F5FD|nr:C39 family peptidase [Halomonas sp. M20]